MSKRSSRRLRAARALRPVAKIRVLSAKDGIYGPLEDQALALSTAATALSTWVAELSTESETLDVVGGCDQHGERAFLDYERTLLETLRAPIDRDDLHCLGCEIDAARKHTTRTVRSLVGDRAATRAVPAVELAALVVRSTDHIARAVSMLRGRAYLDVVALAGELRAVRRESRALHHEGVATIIGMTPALDSRALVESARILERLAETAARCTSVGRRLAYVAVKNH